ncbi:PP2C family protein-serine/threonine phosphatase [Teredinibacter waterburyi]|uniref:PP2C family protein-serine/threonine phosphatase n=1 Tax=Teredinibacter waterburyi TaxID=1500538 RepID=UPI00165ECBAD|nr:protein phosphatase 2C domain-containing protein [Teredinibacter waterburyi]
MSDTAFRPIEWISASQTDVGTVRSVNEDSFHVNQQSGLWVVADGMGGHEVGDVASTKIIEALERVPNIECLSDYIDAVEDALLAVNQEIIEYADIMLDHGTMGSTLAALVIRGRVGVAIWVGDSRVYRFRNGRLTQLSRDHSQVQEMLRMGLISAEEAVNHPQSNVITRAIGGEQDLYIDLDVFSTQMGDTFLICSDGLYNAVEDEELIQCLSERDLEGCALDMLEISLAHQASDNVTLIVVRGVPEKF